MAFAMQCNIDRKGRAVRLVSGIICAAVGIVLVVLALAAEGGFWPLLGTGLGFFAAGIFQIYESRKGWCALRALGVRTPL